ncbi:DNA polymerase III subunit beta [Clostridium tyrobutyricum]|uniref:DNA polymerase III subunit beta n=1 Tax=Clostridium tyrobutyricum TaxID=1519 RepID=UPI001C384576|nr:DNA polymerase III subunit beta [Clostridium tyrobutyricum]MBV4420038.1 DNA polymerase III subunit beta [Clostridium tyrobutyricum]
MKFICNKSNLQEAVFTVQKAITGKSSMPILNGILIETNGNELILTGSDIDLSITTKIEATILEEGSVIINARLFGEIIRRLPNDDINIETIDDNTTQILCKKSKFNIINMNTADFPELPNINENMLFSISENILKNMIRETIFATAQDETRPILTGILFEIKNKTINLIALDGYRLALRFESLDNDNEINAVIPGKTLNEVSKILEDREDNVDITFTPNHILFNLGKTKIVSRLLEGEFIKYKSIIPEEFNLQVTAKREELLNCIERASLMAKDSNTNLIKLNIEDNNMIITSNSQLGMVKEEVNIILQGSNLQIAFNSKYLIDVLKIMDEEEIILNFSSSVSPCVIKNKDKNNCTYLVLPVRLLNN